MQHPTFSVQSLDITSPNKSVFQSAANKLNRYCLAQILEMVSTMRKLQKNYYKEQDKERKRLLLIQCKQMELSIDDYLVSIGL